MKIPSLLLLGLALLVLCLGADARLREGECEVCLKSMLKFESLVAEKQSKAPEAVEDIIRKACRSELKHKSEQRLCYYIGGSADSAASLLREISRPLLNGVPAERICERLKKKDAEICALNYPQQIDLNTVDLAKLRVKQLKNIIAGWNEKCRGCNSKQDYIDLITAKRHLHTDKVDL